MDFQDFLQIVPHLRELSLLGEEAHSHMVPPERMAQMNRIDFAKLIPKEAAVMMLLYPKEGETHLVLIVRNSYKGVHSSQIAFPGGKYEKEDGDFVTTALRETHEEIGVPPKQIEVIRAFTKLYIPPSNFMVYPLLGVSRQEVLFRPDPYEVADIIELPISTLLSDDIVVKVNMNTSYGLAIEVPAFKIEEHLVWGATAMMLSELKIVLNTILNKRNF